MVPLRARPPLSFPMLLSLDLFLIFLMWYMHSMLCGHVSVCVCVRKSLPHVFPASGFEPRPMIGLLSMWCHGLLSTRMRKPLRSSLKNSHLRVQLFGLFDFFFSPSVPARFLFVCVFRPVHFGFWTSSDSRESLSPLLCSGGNVFSRFWECFSTLKLLRLC